MPPVIRFPLASDPSLFVATDLTTPFAISPDGQTVVFTGTTGGGKSRLWVRSLDSPDARELEDTEDASQPAVSPDGKWVAFLVENFNEIRKRRLSGGLPPGWGPPRLRRAQLGLQRRDPARGPGRDSGIHERAAVARRRSSFPRRRGL
jgi:hypothetical protein